MGAPASERRLDWIVDQLGLRAGLHVVEVGGGHGVAAAAVLQRIGAEGRYWGIDRSEKLTAAARSRCADAIADGRARFEVADLLSAEVGPSTQDRVLACRVAAMAHPDPLRTALSWLAPGGRLALAFDHPDTDRTEAAVVDATGAAGTLGATVVDVRRTALDTGTVALVLLAP